MESTLKKFLRVMWDNLQFIAEGKGVGEKLSRLYSFTVSFVVFTMISFPMIFQKKKPTVTGGCPHWSRLLNPGTRKDKT